MSLRLKLIALGLCLPVIASADLDYRWTTLNLQLLTQEWCNDVAVEINRVYTVGYRGSSPNTTPLIIAYDEDGTKLWNDLTDIGTRDVYKAVEVGTGGIYAFGTGEYVGSGEPNDFVVVKYTSNGQRLWQRRFTGLPGSTDTPYAMCLDAGDNIYIAGKSENGFFQRFAFAKFDKDGNLKWSAYGSGATKDTKEITDIVANSYTVAASGVIDSGSSKNGYGIAMKADGTGILWEKVLAQSSLNERTEGVALGGTVAGSDILFSGSRGIVHGSLALDHQIICLARDTGNVKWEYLHHYLGTEYGSDVAVDPDGNVWSTGHSNAGVAGDVIDTVKVNKDGAFQQLYRYNDNVNGTFFYPVGIFVDKNGSVTVGAYTSDSANGKYHLQSIDVDGVQHNQTQNAGPGTNAAYGFGASHGGGVAIAGVSISPNNNDIVTMAFRQQLVLKPDSYIGDEDVSFTTDASDSVRANDMYTAGCVYEKASEPTKGTVNFLPSGVMTYTPNPEANGDDSFTYTATRDGITSDPILVSIKIVPAPVANDDFFKTPADTTLDAPFPGILGNDQFANNGKPNKASDPSHGTVTLFLSGAIKYVPNPGFIGLDTFTYTINRNGSVSDNPGTVTIQVGEMELVDLKVTPVSVVGGSTVVGEVKLNTTAFGDGAEVLLSDNTSALETPVSTTVPAGAIAQTFNIPSSAVNASVVRVVTAKRLGVTKNFNVTILPPAVQSVVLTPNSVIGGLSISATVTLSAKTASTGAFLSITDNSSALTTPSNANVPAGGTSVSFPVGTTYVNADAVRSVTATYAGTFATGNVTIKAGYAVVNLVMTPGSVKGGQPSTGTVTLNKPAPIGGLVVDLSDNTSVIDTPLTVTIPAGASSGNFNVATKPVSQSYVRKITASHNGTTKTADLVLTP